MKNLIQYPIAFAIVAGLSLSAFAANDVAPKKSISNNIASDQAVERPDFVKIDANGDSKISVEEAKSNTWLEKNFVAIDADKNGVITSVEFLAGLKKNA
jgi:hypothetical protein